MPSKVETWAQLGNYIHAPSWFGSDHQDKRRLFGYFVVRCIVREKRLNAAQWTTDHLFSCNNVNKALD